MIDAADQESKDLELSDEAEATGGVTAYEKPDPKKRLGRGLNALFGDDEEPFGDEAAIATVGLEAEAGSDSSGAAEQTKEKSSQIIGIDQLEPGSYQPRRHFDKGSIRELAESIAAHGILQPLIVRPKAGFKGHYEIIAGERRWHAAQIAQLHEIPVVIRTLSDVEALEFGLIENLQREDLNALEEALGYKQLIDEFGHTQEKVAAGLSKSRSHVANTIRLLLLPPKVQDMVRGGDLSAGHARALITADNPEEIARLIVQKGLSVREAEKMASGHGKTKASSDKAGQSKDAQSSKYEKDVNTISLENEMTEKIGMKVTIDVKPSGTGAGALKIDFKSLDQLDDILKRLS